MSNLLFVIIDNSTTATLLQRKVSTRASTICRCAANRPQASSSARAAMAGRRMRQLRARGLKYSAGAVAPYRRTCISDASRCILAAIA
ncbi:hypothetical protein EVAR_100232_1 [Eumeta japonica]|uniref:Uncharacterized protein n=1 Tax=Eumeta variegata TaxID=151549 RepID=A0A4C1ZYQ2_EUMVA|nr:hypothetical protein EVAR_100232_1 [Eumeta japonica]